LCGFHAAISSSQGFDYPDRLAQNGVNLSIWRKLLLPVNRIVIGVLIISSLATSACSAQDPARNGMGGIAAGLAG